MTESKSQRSFTERELAFVETHPNRILRQKAAAKYVGLTAKTLRVYKWNETGPPHVQLGQHAVGYRVRDLDAWLDARTKQRTAVEE